MEVITRIPIDLTYLHSVSGGDAGFEKMLLISAVEDIQNNIDLLKKAWSDGNAMEAGTAAHTLKSVMTIAGLRQLEVHCKRIDTTLRDGIFHPELYDAFARITDGWLEARPRLEALIADY